MSEFDIGELADEEVIKSKRKKRGFAEIIDNLILTTVGLLIIVIILVYIANVSFGGEISLQRVGYDGAILYCASLAIYILLYAFSRRKGRLTDKHIQAEEDIQANVNAIAAKGLMGRAAEYCRNWEETELYNARNTVLAPVNISVEEFVEKYAKYNKRELRGKYPELSESEIKTILTARKLKRLRYDEKYLTASITARGRCAPSGGIKANTLDTIRIIRVSVVSLIMCLFSATLVIQVVASPSFATVIMCAVKLLFVCGSGAIGMYSGYTLSSVREVNEMKEKAAEQKNFIAYCDNEFIKGK